MFAMLIAFIQKTEMVDAVYYSGVAITVLILNALSFVSLTFVIVIYIIRWKHIASFPMRLSFYLCISCIIQNLYVIIYPPEYVNADQNAGGAITDYCIFEALLKTAFDLSSIIWTAIIMYSSYASVVRQAYLDKLEYSYLICGFFAPILLALVPIFLEDYGFNVYYCWFDSPNPNIEFGLKMGYYFGPLWILFFLENYWAFRTFRKLKKLGLQSRQLNIFKKIFLFPLILFITGIFPTIDLIYIYSTESFQEWLDAASYFTVSAYGLCTSLAYGFNPLIQDQILILFKIKPPTGVRESTSNSQTSRRTNQFAELITM